MADSIRCKLFMTKGLVAADLGTLVDADKTNPSCVNERIISTDKRTPIIAFLSSTSDIASIVQLKVALNQIRQLDTEVVDLYSEMTNAKPNGTLYCVPPSPEPTAAAPRTQKKKLENLEKLLKQLRKSGNSSPYIDDLTTQIDLTAGAPKSTGSEIAQDAGYFGLGILSNASQIASLVGVAAQIASSTETVSAAQGALANASLYNRLAEDLDDFKVVVPSSYPPGLIKALDMPEICDAQAYHTCTTNSVTSRLSKLVTDRQQLLHELDSTFSTYNCSGERNAPIVVRRVLESAQVFATVDSFILSLFGGQASSVPPAAAPTAAPNNTNNQNAPQNPQSKSTPTPMPTANPLIAVATLGLPTLTSITASAPLVQLFTAELLLARLDPDHVGPAATTAPVFLVVAQANESGGSTLTQNGFFGNRVFYSGGAVETFALYDLDGQPLCSGTTIGYRGFIAVDRIRAVIEKQGHVDKYPDPATIGISSNCVPGKVDPIPTPSHT